MDSIVKRGVVILLGLIIITFGVKWLMHRMHAYKELQESRKPKPLDDDDDLMMIEGFWGVPEWMFSILHELQTILAQITAYMGIFTTITIYTIVLASLNGIAVGIFNHFICGGEWFVFGFVNGIQAAGIMLKCMAEKLGSILTGDCLRFYVVDIIYGLIYFIGSAVLSIIWTITGVDLQPIIGMGWNLTVEPLDSMIFSLTGHHITRWSDATHTRCYKCAANFAPNGENSKYYDQLNIYDWGSVLWCSIDGMKEGVYKMVTAIIPSRKWGAWSRGHHQDGGDDDPPFTF
jgi:hypothetical protein